MYRVVAVLIARSKKSQNKIRIVRFEKRQIDLRPNGQQIKSAETKYLHVLINRVFFFSFLLAIDACFLILYNLFNVYLK